MFGIQSGHRRNIGPVTFFDPVRNIKRSRGSKRPEIVQQNGRRRPTIDIVIGKYRDTVLADGTIQPFRGLSHVLQVSWVGHQIAQFGVQKRRNAVRLDPARGQYQGQGAVKLRILLQRLGHSLDLSSWSAPEATG